MPSTLTSDQMKQAAKKPVVIDLDSAAPPKRERQPVPASMRDETRTEPVEVEIEFKPSPALDERIEAGADDEPAPKPTPAEKKRAAARRASGPPKDVAPAEFVRKENIPVRVRDEDEVYSVWNCAESPDESIRVNDERLLRFQRGTLKCLTAADDEAVAIANQYAGGKYIRGDITRPIKSELTKPPTYWYSEEALLRHQRQYMRDTA